MQSGAFGKFLPACCLLALVAMLCFTGVPARAQAPASAGERGSIVGTVTDVNDNILPGATVLLQGPTPEDSRKVTTNTTGFYELHDVRPGISYHLVISAQGFADWTSPEIALPPGTAKIVNGTLNLQVVETTVTVTPSTEEIAVEQVHQELHQHVLGIIPNYYVVYDPNPVPLTPKLKFELAFKTTLNPITFVALVIQSGIGQATRSPDYVEGAKGLGQRLGANAASDFSDILFGGAILPTVLHQDPRYYYKGTGTNKARTWYAIRSAFVCKGDNGKWQPNYSTMGGDLASAGLANFYLPNSDRGVGNTFENFAINTAERAGSNLLQEFVLRKLTHMGKAKD